MMDAVDYAQDFDQMRRELAIGEVLKEVSRPGTDYCTACGCEIEEPRKAAMPSATRCIDCQSNFEKSKRFKR